MNKITALLAFFLSSLSLFAQPTELTPDKNATPSNPAYTTLAASNGVVYGNDGNPFVLETRKFQAYSELRTFSMPTVGVFYQVWLSDRLEFWKADFNDNSTPDNNSTTLIGVSNIRYKRFFSSLTNPLTTEFKGTWNASTNQPALTTTPAGNGSYYLVSQGGTQSITGLPENYEAGDQVISNGTGWFRIRSSLVDGSVSEGKIATGAVSPAKTTFIAPKPGKNLFSKAAAKDSTYMSETGSIVTTNPGYTLSDFIEVEPNQPYFGKGSDSRGMRFTTFFNAAKTVVTGGSANFTTSVVPTANTKYVRVSILTSDKNSFQFEKGTSQTSYSDYVVSQVLTGVQVDSAAIRPASVTATRIADRAITPAKIAPKSITSALIASKTITASEVSFIAPGKNLFNVADTSNRISYYVSSVQNGVPQASSTYNTTHFIRVEPATTYYPSYKHSLAYYDENKAYLSAESNTRTNQYFTTPAGTAYVRLTVVKASWATFQLEVGSVGSDFEPYGGKLTGVQFAIPDSSITTAALKSNAVTSGKLATGSVTTTKIAPKSITAALIASKAVTPNEVSFITSSKNLFDKTPSKLRIGYYINENGVETANASYVTSDYMPVTSGLPYYGKGSGNVGMRFVSYYSSNTASSYVKGGPAQPGTFTFTAPAGINYARVSIVASDTTSFQLEQNTVQTAYADYGNTLTDVKTSVPVNSVSSAELKVNAVTTDKIATAAVTAPKAAFLTLSTSKNLFNKKTKEVGYFINENGVKNASSTYTLSDYILIKSGLPYFGKGAASTGMRFVSYYTTNSAAGFVTGGPSTATTTFTPPAGVNYVRLSILTADTASFQLEQNTVQTAYEDFKEVYVLKETGREIQAEGLTAAAKSQIVSDVKASLATEKPLSSDYTIATKIYWPVGRQLEIYPENCLKYYEKWKGYLDLTSTIAGSKQTGRALKATPATAGTYTVTTSALDGNYDAAYTVTTQVQAVPLTNTNPVKILNFGDSYTLRSTFTNRLNATIPQGVTYLGIRRTTASTPTQNAEGRGGYLMSTYHTLHKNTTQFSPFMQPTGNNYKYYGVTGFWKIVHGAGGYDWDNYENVKGMFDATTGYLKAPNTDDVQYDNALSKFVRWDGSAWVDIAESTLNFTWNFAKYRQAWNIVQPDIFHSMLGTNDGANLTETTFPAMYATFKARYETMIASIKADSPNCKIIIAIPVSSGRQGVDGIATTERRKRVFWLLAKALNADFSGRESQGVYIADYHSTVDRTYGYDRTYEKPFFNYTGSETEPYLSDAVHIGQAGFNQEGEQYMALIQLLRP